jgi:hypothetical protein
LTDEEGDEVDENDNHATNNNRDPGFVPPPFTNIMGFRSNSKTDLRASEKARDRSHSFDVNAQFKKSPRLRQRPHGGAGVSGGVANMSIRQIRKMVSAQAHASDKQNLRKSLSNPSFLNLGSKEKLNQLRVSMTTTTTTNTLPSVPLPANAASTTASVGQRADTLRQEGKLR